MIILGVGQKPSRNSSIDKFTKLDFDFETSNFVRPFVKRRKRINGYAKEIIESFRKVEEEQAQCEADDERSISDSLADKIDTPVQRRGSLRSISNSRNLHAEGIQRTIRHPQTAKQKQRQQGLLKE